MARRGRAAEEGADPSSRVPIRTNDRRGCQLLGCWPGRLLRSRTVSPVRQTQAPNAPVCSAARRSWPVAVHHRTRRSANRIEPSGPVRRREAGSVAARGRKADQPAARRHRSRRAARPPPNSSPPDSHARQLAAVRVVGEAGRLDAEAESSPSWQMAGAGERPERRSARQCDEPRRTGAEAGTISRGPRRGGQRAAGPVELGRPRGGQGDRHPAASAVRPACARPRG